LDSSSKTKNNKDAEESNREEEEGGDASSSKGWQDIQLPNSLVDYPTPYMNQTEF